MKKGFLVAFLLLYGFSFLLSQIHKDNLVVDGGFEERTDLECLHPNDVLDFTRYWYRSWGTPDFHVKDCPNLRNGPAGTFLSSHMDRSYMGISGRARFIDFFASEAFGTQLEKPLKAGYFYYFEAEIENKGVWDSDIYPFQICPISPEKRIAVTFAKDSILDKEAYKNPTIILDEEGITSFEHQDWKTYSACFQAKGGERHMGLSFVQDEFEIDAPCAPFDTLGNYFMAFAYFDHVRVQEIAPSFQDTITFCRLEGEVSFDAGLWLEGMDLGELKYEWEDGLQGARRTFDTPGTYPLKVRISCGEIEGKVLVQEKDCRVFFYVPSGFSPNGDLHNDVLTPTLRTDINVTRFQFRIFDRWGRMVKQLNQVGESWDGTYQGRPLPPGVYVWESVMTLDREGEFLAERENGTITLIR